jgi:hypothetical protein
LLTGQTYSDIYNQELAKANQYLTVDSEEIKKYVEQIGGKGAKWDSNKETITDSEGNVIEDISLDYFKSLYANEQAALRFKAAGENAYGMVDIVKNLSNDQYLSDSAIENLFSEQGGLGLTR